MGNCCGLPPHSGPNTRRNYRIRPADSLASRQTEDAAAAAAPVVPAGRQNGKLSEDDSRARPNRRRVTEQQLQPAKEEEEAEEPEPNFDDEFDGESLSNASSWASGLSEDNTDRPRLEGRRGKTDSMRAEGGSRLHLEAGDGTGRPWQGNRGSQQETERKKRHPASRSSSETHHHTGRRRRRERPNSLSVRPRGHLPTPKASPDDEIFWIPSSLAKHMGYYSSLTDRRLPPPLDRAVTAAETGGGVGRGRLLPSPHHHHHNPVSSRDLPSISINETVVFTSSGGGAAAAGPGVTAATGREAAAVGEAAAQERGLLEEVMDQLYDRPRSLTATAGPPAPPPTSQQPPPPTQQQQQQTSSKRRGSPLQGPAPSQGSPHPRAAGGPSGSRPAELLFTAGHNSSSSTSSGFSGRR